jgi:YfiH family protein
MMLSPELLDFEGHLGGGVRGFTSTRRGGTSRGAYASLNLGTNTGDDPARVLANRRAAIEAGGLDASKGVFLQQVHGQRILEASALHAGAGLARWEEGLPGCDAVFTREKGLGLAIGHADCLALVLVDAQAGLLGVAHAGWRGALAGLPGGLAQRLVDEGAQASRLRALLSPCLSPAWLELGEDQHRLFSQTFKTLSGFASPLSQGKFHLDLRACAVEQLLGVGLRASHIVAQPLCSYARADLFFSYRRDQGDTGRHLTVAALV